jgi:hypothetical protein
MTAPTVDKAPAVDPTPAVDQAPAPGRTGPRRRWLRLVVPYAIVATLVAGTAVAYALQEPDATDRAFLAPSSTADIGASTLATRLRARGITVERHTRTPDALVSAHRGRATLFVPAPDLMHTHYLRMLKLMPASTPVVLVRPSGRTLRRGRLPADSDGDAWAARAVPPACADPVATAAGPAAVLRQRYAAPLEPAAERCYGGGLLRTRHRATTLTLVGATDPFRNDRIDEHGNSALAVGLLAAAPRVVWLDVHDSERGPAIDDRPGRDESPAPASLGRGSPDPDFPVPDPDGTDPGEPDPRDPPPRSGGSADDESSVFDLFPAGAWAVLALALLAAVLAALARARRLGAPVPEPLPVLVPSTETVTGRGRLYQRSRDRGAALAVLRTAARDRLARLLDQATDVPDDALVAILAAHAGDDADTIHDLLHGPPPATDAELVATAAALDTLIAAVTHLPGKELQ